MSTAEKTSKERPKGAYIKYVGGVGPEGFTIFLKSIS